MAGRVDGISAGMIAAGGLLAYTGVKGISIPGAITNLIQGQSPAAAARAAQISGTPQASMPPGSVPGGEPGITPPSTTSETDWIQSFLASVGAPATQANINSVSSWIAHEAPWNSSPPDGALYTNNPLNTTEPGFGATGSVNSVGVKIYPTVADGLAATQAVITNGRYEDILMVLRGGGGLCGHTLSGLSVWSGGGYSSVC